MSENPLVAGLPSRVFDAPGAVTPYTLAKISANETVAMVGTADTAADVFGVFLNGRTSGQQSGIAVGTVRGALYPMLADGASALAAKDRVDRSALTAGRVALTSSGGIGSVVQGCAAVADSVVLVCFDGISSAGTGMPAGFFNVVDYGATGDGSTDDGPAFQAAFDAAEATRGGIVYAPPCSGQYKIATPVVVNCGTSDAFVYTLLAVGKILIATGPDADAFEMSNNGSLIFDRCTFVGNLETTVPAVIDCRHMIVAAGQTNLLFRDCRILGVMASTTPASTALVQVSGTVRYERTVFGGCSASYCHETVALHNFECDDLRFYDYWYADGVTYSKTPYGVSHWVHIETGASAEPIEGAISQATIQIRNISFDEGAQNALVIYGASSSTKVDRVMIDGVTALQSNQSNSHVLYLDGIKRCVARNVAVKTPADHDYIQVLNVDSLVIEETTRNPAFPARIDLGANIGSSILRNIEADSIHGTGAALAVVENNGYKQLLPYATGSLPNPSALRDGVTVLDTTVPAVAVVVGGAWKKATLT